MNGAERVGCSITLREDVIADVIAEDRKTAKRDVSGKALQLLKQHCWTIKVKKTVDSEEPGLTRDEVSGEAAQSVIPESNIGSKLLKKMGWSGGGVGKYGAGIAEPVSMSSVINREGLGMSAEKGIATNFAENIKKAIQSYVRSNDQNDLVFSSSFTKEERAIIHKESVKFNLKSVSHGQGEERFLSLSRKRTAYELFLYIQAQGGETSKYILLPPGCS